MNNEYIVNITVKQKNYIKIYAYCTKTKSKKKNKLVVL